MGAMQENPAHVPILEEWMKSYGPEELFDENGGLRRAGRPRACGYPPHERNPHTNGGVLLREICGSRAEDYAVAVPAPGPSRPSPPG